mgnify:CR=1 FL=1
MNEQDLRNFAVKAFAAYKESHPGADGQEYFIEGYLAGAARMAEYIHNAIMFMAENNPKL